VGLPKRRSPREAVLLKSRDKIYFEDFTPGEVLTLGAHSVTADEIIEYAKKWDPQPRHIDPEAAKESSFGGLVASGAHIFAISVRLLVTQNPLVAVIAVVGCDKVRFTQAVRPGDVLTSYFECVETRPSRTKADRGIVRNKVTLVNQNGEQVLSYIDTILVFKRLTQM
jgi:acyl dehydratase